MTTSNFRLVLIVLGLALLFLIVGVLYLVAQGREVPDLIKMVLTGDLTALTSLLVTPRNRTE